MPLLGAQFAAWAMSRFGLPIIVAGALILFYEGLPLGPLRYLPLGVGHAIESVADGRVDRQRRAGETQERLLWQEAERRAKAKAEADLAAKQSEIDAITIDRTDDANRAAALERALAEEKARNANDNRPALPRVPRSVSERLDATGRH